MSLKQFLILSLLFSFNFACKTEPQTVITDEVVAALVQPQNVATPLDVAATYPQLSEADCYTIQKEVFLQAHGLKDLAGYKAALTSAGSQALLETDHPAAGFLYKSGWRADGDTILSAAYTLPFVELELGFYTNTTIEEFIPDVAALKDKIATVYPVIELPDIGFPSIDQVKLATFITHNAASKSFIIGEGTPLMQIEDLNGLTFALSADDVLLGEAKSSDAMGDQWEALLFLINQRVEMGLKVEPNHVLITGSLGRLFPFETGAYFADFGTLGSLSFYIK